MKKLLIGAMLASLFMVNSDANAGLFSSMKSLVTKKKTTSEPDLSSSNLRRTQSDSALSALKKKSKVEIRNFLIENMGEHYEASVFFMYVILKGLDIAFTKELPNQAYFNSQALEGPANANAKNNVTTARKAISVLATFVQRLLDKKVPSDKEMENAVDAAESLQSSLSALVGSKFWKRFGNHIRYSVINIRNCLNMLLFPNQLWSVGGVIFSLNSGNQGQNGDGNFTTNHLGAEFFEDPKDEQPSSDIILSLRNAFNTLINELLTTEGYQRAEKAARKLASQKRLDQTTDQSIEAVSESYEKITGKNFSRNNVATSRNNVTTRDRYATIDDDDYEDEDISGEAIDEEAYNEAWTRQATRNKETNEMRKWSRSMDNRMPSRSRN